MMNSDSRTRTIARLIALAERHVAYHEWDEAAGRCYEILALDPANGDAPRTLGRIYQQHELVNDMRRALDRLFCHTHASLPLTRDRGAHSLRRKLAFSYRVLSRWEGWLCADDEGAPVSTLEEAAEMLDHAYFTGEEHDLSTVWGYYVRACAHPSVQRRAVQWWMARQYAQHGFFADAAEILTELLALHPTDPHARYMLAELRWWRDHAHSLLWLR
jgi:tetratricopeptide (TPR) repeat protein